MDSFGARHHQKRRNSSNISQGTEDKTNGGEKDYSAPIFITDSDLTIPDGTYFPPLEKVLMNQSGSPLSQYNFYTYLKQEWQGEENLKFWLDVIKHEHLFKSWRDYQNYIKKSREESDRKRARGKDVEGGDIGVEGDEEERSEERRVGKEC